MDAFVRLRWAETDGEPYCPYCGCAVVYRIDRNVKNRKTGQIVGKRRKFTCAECLKQFSPTSGTMFHGRKLEHRDILFGIGLWVNGAKGEAALHLCRDMNVNVKTAFLLEKKLREVMGRSSTPKSCLGRSRVTPPMSVATSSRPTERRTAVIAGKRRTSPASGRRSRSFGSATASPAPS